MPKPPLIIENLMVEAASFAAIESKYDEPALYGVTDGKAVGTYLEHKFRSFLVENYDFHLGNSASGVDFPELNIDMKVTSIRQPQSSCPYKSARQKIYGLGYGLLIFVYDKVDDHKNRTGKLDMKHTIYVEDSRTADYQMTRGLNEILDRDGNEDDVIGFFMDKNLPVDEIEAGNIAREVIKNRPLQGYLTISNALQWRLQYTRAIAQAGCVEGIQRVR